MHRSRVLRLALGATMIATLVCLPAALPATEFGKFDKMSTDAQAEYIAVMVDATQKALRAEGKAGLADQIEQLFTKVASGDKMSLGLVELERNIARARVFDLQRAEKDPKAERLDVEDALFVTLKKNNIELSDAAINTVLKAMTNFHPMTNGEFEAKSIAEQRSYVALLAKLAWPDEQFRNEVAAKIAGKEDTLAFDPGMLEVVAAEFPAQSPNQPGFEEIAKKIADENTKAPNATGPFYQLMVEVLEGTDAKVVSQMKQMDEETVVLPDGRSVFKDKNGDLWAVSKDGPGTKLEGRMKELAERLADCKFAHGIAKGRDALAICRDEAGITDADAAPAAAATPAVPAAPPPPEDDPIGAGGFITPPSKFPVMVCVQQVLVDKEGWGAPRAGSKMAAFQDVSLRYIQSVAKPSWEYWIVEGQFERFNPQAQESGDRLVSAVSPDSGRFDEFDPRCPAGYAGYTMQVSH